MDLVSTLRKEGTSRGGVNFSWSDVQTSTRRENYLGHSIMAPVGRWQKNKDLSWYAKADDKDAKDGETEEERRVRERKEEIRRVKEAEEDALARALGLPVKDRSSTNPNMIDVGEMRKVIKEAGEGEDVDEADTRQRFGDHIVGAEELHDITMGDGNPSAGGLVGKDGHKLDKTERRRERSRSRDRRHRRHHRHRSPDDYEGHRERARRRSTDRHERRHRSRSPAPKHRRHRSRSDERLRDRKDDRRHREDSHKTRRSRSPERKQRRRERD